jgi:hypothetical protein
MKKILVVIILLLSISLYSAGWQRMSNGNYAYYNTKNQQAFYFTDYYFTGHGGGSGGWIANLSSKTNDIPTIGPSFYYKTTGIGMNSSDELTIYVDNTGIISYSSTGFTFDGVTITDIETGAGDNDKLVTQGYGDDNWAGGAGWADKIEEGTTKVEVQEAIGESIIFNVNGTTVSTWFETYLEFNADMALDYGEHFYMLHNGWGALDENDNYRMGVDSDQDWNLSFYYTSGASQWGDIFSYDESAYKFLFNPNPAVGSGIVTIGLSTIDKSDASALTLGGTASKVWFKSLMDTDNNWISGDGGSEGIQVDDSGNIIMSNDADVVADLTAGTIVSDGIVTATTTVQGEHLYSTDDAEVYDDLDVGGDADVIGTITGEHLASTDDAAITDDFDVGGLSTLDGIVSDGDEGNIIYLDATLADGEFTSSEVYKATAGMTLAFGDVIYFKSADSEVYIPDADDNTTFRAIGICVTAGTDSNPVYYIKSGRIMESDWNFAKGSEMYVKAASSSGDNLTITAPTTDNYVIQRIGKVVDTDIIEVSFPYPFFYVNNP